MEAQLTVRIPKEYADALAEIAKREERSIAWVVRRAIHEYLDSARRLPEIAVHASDAEPRLKK